MEDVSAVNPGESGPVEPEDSNQSDPNREDGYISIDQTNGISVDEVPTSAPAQDTEVWALKDADAFLAAELQSIRGKRTQESEQRLFHRSFRTSYQSLPGEPRGEKLHNPPLGLTSSAEQSQIAEDEMKSHVLDEQVDELVK